MTEAEKIDRPDSPKPAPAPGTEAGVDRRRALKVGFLTVSAVVAGQVYQKPTLAASGGAQEELSPGVTEYTWQRALPTSFFPGMVGPPDCDPSQYQFSGMIHATTSGNTITIDTINLIGTLAAGQDRGTVRITNVGNFSGTCDPSGNFTTSGAAEYVDANNPAPVPMPGATLNGRIFGPSDVQIQLDGCGAAVCGSSEVLASMCMHAT